MTRLTNKQISVLSVLVVVTAIMFAGPISLGSDSHQALAHGWGGGWGHWGHGWGHWGHGWGHWGHGWGHWGHGWGHWGHGWGHWGHG